MVNPFPNTQKTMKTTIPLATFDLQSLLNTVADFTDAVCGEEFQAATLATEAELDELFNQDWSNLPRFQREERFPELEKKLARGETLVLAIASPYVGEPVDFVDGSKYKLGEDDSLGGETDYAVLFVNFLSSSNELAFETGMMCGNGCMCPPSLSRGPIGPLENATEIFIKRFLKS
jgi:hypothetical protein